ncbi:hypothetical protein [Ochrobactrum quorumnocens]|uniref:hypothetical protein n=1 Tax=Ochrobactrum quorumnocens TaxID=271865 RepID=UPI003BA03BEE
MNKAVPQTKIFLRVLLFSTGKHGRVGESLFLRVREGEHQTEFSFWGMGDKDLVRGSGLFVSETGTVTNHHFNPLDADELFMFKPGIRNEEKARRAKSKRPSPFSIRLSQEERTRLYCGLTASPFWDDGRSPRAG